MLLLSSSWVGKGEQGNKKQTAFWQVVLQKGEDILARVSSPS
jgi:hypothetical protein